MAPFTSKKAKLNLGVRKSRVCLPDTEATREKLKRDEAARKWGHARLDELFEEWQESKQQSTSTDEAFNTTGPFDDEGPDEQSNIPHQEINNPEIPASFVEYISGDRYKSQRIKEHNDWKRIMPEIFISFMQCSHHTSQWGNQGNWNHDFQKDLATCFCDSNSKTVWEMDAVDLNCKCSCEFGIMRSGHLIIDLKMHPARKKLNVEFCQCTPDQVRLIRQGFLGGSPVEPRTAFSLRLLRFYHILWKECSTAILPFSRAIDEYLDAHNDLMLVKDSYQVFHFLLL